MSVSEQEGAPRGVAPALGAEHIRDAVFDRAPRRSLADGGRAARARPIGPPVGPRAVEHGPGEHLGLGAALLSALLHEQPEGLFGPGGLAERLALQPVRPGDAPHARALADLHARPQGRGQGQQVVRPQLRAREQRLRRRQLTPLAAQHLQPGRSRIPPEGGEEPQPSPGADVVRHLARFKQDRRESRTGRAGRGLEPDRPSSDDGKIHRPHARWLQISVVCRRLGRPAFPPIPRQPTLRR